MIEADTCYPSDWSTWNSSSLSPYLELYGETQPYMCTNLTETLPANSMNNDPQMEVIAPIYEYFWTIGISEHLYDQISRHVENVVDELRHHQMGAEVTMYFPVTGGWRVEEVVATIKYVRPLPHRDDLVKKVADYWNTVAPVISKVADLTEQLHVPGVSTGATLLNMLAKVPITSLPPVDGLTWNVKRVTGYVTEVMDGVRWTLPEKLFYILGSRVTGSLAVYFHPAQHHPHRLKQPPAASDDQPRVRVQTRPILAQAVVHHSAQRIPAIEEEYIKLDVTPNPMPPRAKKEENSER